ncbi:short-chain dehydrogenase [Penicillium malachiteum]|uniref:short-chain dehydrogenase n=1 Tax=Penicillium malachiteum TaxID=1324776 RepID=UPI0025489BB9|nr:short-chain dehydrogenase [Penicillium malachiteum]KAJ5731634.1 short-chain dehydrogenase [Penicillium malachiteum]
MSNFNYDTTGEEVASVCSDEILGKIILITGPSPNSLAAKFAMTISVHAPAMIILASRDTSKLEELAASIKEIGPAIAIRILRLDLSSQASIREAAQEVNSYEDVPYIDVLVNSAGLMAVPYSQTQEGIELQFGVNHVGHFLFTNLIMGKLISEDGSRSSRVLNVSSVGHELSRVRFEDYNFKDGQYYNRWYAYGQSKSANMLFSVALAARLAKKGLICVSLHPGSVFTNLSSHLDKDAWEELGGIGFQLGLPRFTSYEGLDYKTQQQGVATYVFGAFHESITQQVNGRHLRDSQVLEIRGYKSWARDPTDAEELWKLSETLVGQEFNY